MKRVAARLHDVANGYLQTPAEARTNSMVYQMLEVIHGCYLEALPFSASNEIARLVLLSAASIIIRERSAHQAYRQAHDPDANPMDLSEHEIGQFAAHLSMLPVCFPDVPKAIVLRPPPDKVHVYFYSDLGLPAKT